MPTRATSGTLSMNPAIHMYDSYLIRSSKTEGIKLALNLPGKEDFNGHEVLYVCIMNLSALLASYCSFQRNDRNLPLIEDY